MDCRKNEWFNIFLCDKIHLYIYPNNSRIFIWRERGNRNNLAFVQRRLGCAAMMVYPGISTNGRTEHQMIWNGALAGLRYGDEIIRPTVVPYAAVIGDDFILMDVNCKPYRVYFVDPFLLEKKSYEWNGQRVLRTLHQ